jgi:hypothetical protein
MGSRLGLVTVALIGALTACSSGPAQQAGPRTSMRLPGHATFVATPTGRRDLSSAQALAIAQRANAELEMPSGTVAIHGRFTNTATEATPVWAFRSHSCEVPHAAIKTVNRLCTRWVFLQSHDGSFVEATWSP